MIDKMDVNRMVFVVLNHRGTNPLLRRWLTQFPQVMLASHFCSFAGRDLLACWRNQIVEHFLTLENADWLIMCDDDVIPIIGETEKLLECEADVSACRYFARYGVEAHPEEGEIGLHIAKISRKALEKIKPPWFAFEMNEKGTAQRTCECDYFCKKAKEAGFYPVKAGIAGHLIEVYAIPTDNPKQCAIKFPPLYQGIQCAGIEPLKKL